MITYFSTQSYLEKKIKIQSNLGAVNTNVNLKNLTALDIHNNRIF